MQSVARAQERPFLLQTTHTGPRPPTPASASGAARLSHLGCFSSALDVHRRLVVSTLIKIQASGEGAGLNALRMESGFSQMLCVCPRAAGTDDHRLGGSSEHRCVTFESEV